MELLSQLFCNFFFFFCCIGLFQDWIFESLFDFVFAIVCTGSKHPPPPQQFVQELTYLQVQLLATHMTIGLTWCRCYKTFYGRNFRISTISQSVCSWHAYPAYSNVCKKGWTYPSEVSSSWPYPQTLDQVGKDCQGQTRELVTKIRKLQL